MASSSWDKLGKFKANLRKAFVGANMWIEFTPKELSAYYKYLKEMYRSRGERHFYLVEVLGRQPDTDYWVFSREVRSHVIYFPKSVLVASHIKLQPELHKEAI